MTRPWGQLWVRCQEGSKCSEALTLDFTVGDPIGRCLISFPRESSSKCGGRRCVGLPQHLPTALSTLEMANSTTAPKRTGD